MTAVLEVNDLRTRFDTPDGPVRAVNDVSFAVEAGESVGIVGESGSGKSQVFLSVMGLLARNGSASGSVRLRGEEILGIPRKRLDTIRGADVAMIFQDPMTSLNPYLRVSRQMTEVLVEHRGTGESEARAQAIEQLRRVGIPQPERCIDMYPHELSGGMRQRVMIATALLCRPALLIADEPTTALDVTVQAQILELMVDLRRRFDTAIVLITHDMGVIAGFCDRVLVMYAGGIVETGPVREIFYEPRHPYTRGLLESMPRLDAPGQERLHVIPGHPPDAQTLPEGCAFYERCGVRLPHCAHAHPPLRALGRRRAMACHRDDTA